MKQRDDGQGRFNFPFDGWQRARRNDPVTSKLAAARAGFRVGSHAWRTLAALQEHGTMNFSEIALASGLRESQVWRRLPELQRAGYVDVKLGEDGNPLLREGGSGDKQRVWLALL